MCGQRPVVCFPAVLLPCVISNTYHIDISRPDTLAATEPNRPHTIARTAKSLQAGSEGASGPWPGPARVWFAVSSSSSSLSSKIRYPILTWALLQQNPPIRPAKADGLLRFRSHRGRGRSRLAAGVQTGDARMAKANCLRAEELLDHRPFVVSEGW